MAVTPIQFPTTTPEDTRTFSQPEILGKEDFLNLLVAQLANQNPLDPMGDQEFIAQLAQFSSLEQLRNVDDSIKQMLTLQESSINALSLGLIGREAKVQSNVVDTSYMDESVKFEFFVPEETNLNIQIFDENGTVVYQTQVQEVQGWTTVEWDGTDFDGNKVPDGKYKIEATSSVDSSGEHQVFPAYVTGTVLGVDFSSGSAVVNVDGIFVDMSRIVEVKATPSIVPPDDPSEEEEQEEDVTKDQQKGPIRTLLSVMNDLGQ